MKEKKDTNLLSYQDVENKVAILLPGLEKALKVVLAVAIASYYQRPVMLWILLVDVPSSGKTDLVRLIKDVTKITYYLDNLTTNAFVSGERATKTNKVHDLLPLLNGKCFVVKDWTSIFSLDEKATKKLIGDLVNIYDKEFAKFSSARGIIAYESYFSHLGCITPATLNKHTTYLNMVGARFLFYILPTVSEEDKELSRKRIFGGENRSINEKLVRGSVSKYVEQLLTRQWDIKPLSEQAQKYLSIGADIIAHCRGIVILEQVKFISQDDKTRTSYEVIDKQIEEPWRALLQLKALAECITFAVGKNDVGIEELEIIKEVVLASMPADRSQAIRTLQKCNGILTSKQLSDNSERSYKTSQRLLNELYGLNVLNKMPGSGSMATDFKISDAFKDFICQSTAEFLSSYSSGTETPHSMVKEETSQNINTDNKNESPWEQYILKQAIEDLEDETLSAMLEFSKNYAEGEIIPLEYREKFKEQAINLEKECEKRGIL